MQKDEFLKKLVSKSENIDVIQEIKKQKLPLIIWGAGNVALSIKKLFEKESIKIDACWVNVSKDECNGNETSIDIPVMSSDEILKKYGKVNIICGHSRYDLIDEVKAKNSFINSVYCLVNLIYDLYKGIEYDFVVEHAEEYLEILNMLGDDLSKECLIAYLNSKLSGNYRYILPCCRELATYFENPIFPLTNNEDYVDVGAYNGDTLKMFLSAVSDYHYIYTFEVEKNNYRKLCQYCESNEIKKITNYQYGCWDEDTILYFKEGTHQVEGIISTTSGEHITVYRLDTILANKPVSFIKINFLKGTTETLKGASSILQTQKPKLSTTVGFNEWGIIKIPQMIKQINPDYKIYLRYGGAMPARLLLFAY